VDMVLAAEAQLDVTASMNGEGAGDMILTVKEKRKRSERRFRWGFWVKVAAAIVGLVTGASILTSRPQIQHFSSVDLNPVPVMTVQPMSYGLCQGMAAGEAMSLVSDANILLTSVADGSTFNILALRMNDAGEVLSYQAMVMGEQGWWQVGWLPGDQVILDYNCAWIWSGAPTQTVMNVPIMTTQATGPYAVGERVWITELDVDQTAEWRLSYRVVNSMGVAAVLNADQVQYARQPWLPYAADIPPTAMDFFQVRLPERSIITPVSRLQYVVTDGRQRWQVQLADGQFVTLAAEELMYPLLPQYFTDRTLGMMEATMDPYLVPGYPTPAPPQSHEAIATMLIAQATQTAAAFLNLLPDSSACWLSPVNPTGVQTLWADASRSVPFVQLEGTFSAEVLRRAEVNGEVWYQVRLRQGDSEAQGWLEAALVNAFGC
jgi:hypothetical protein